MNLDDYSYTLSEKLIAQKPSKPRDSCKLLVLNNKVTHTIFKNITNYLYFIRELDKI